MRTKHPDQAFWRRFRRSWFAVRLVFAKLIITFLLALWMWGFTMLAISTFADHRGAIRLSEPFLSAYPETMFAAYMVPIGAIAMGMIVRVMYWHRRAWVGFGVFWILALFFTTLDYTISTTGDMLAAIGHFSSPSDIPSAHEMLQRLSFFGVMSVIAAMGLVPGVWLGRVIEKSTKRKFRKIRKKIRKRRAYGN